MSYSPEEKMAGDAMRQAHAFCPTDLPHLERMRWMGKYVYDQLAATLRQQAARVDDQMIERAWLAYDEAVEMCDSPELSEKLHVAMRAALEAALSAQPAERQGEACDAALTAYREAWDATGTPWPGMTADGYLAHQRAVMAVAALTHPAAPVGVPDALMDACQRVRETRDAWRSGGSGPHTRRMEAHVAAVDQLCDLLAAAPSAPQGVG